MSDKPKWWPENPYHKSVFIMERGEYAKIVPDEKTRTGLSGMLGREFWDIASDVIWEEVEQQISTLQAELDDYHNAEKFVADPPHDEVHCGCVGILRKQISDLQREVELLKETDLPTGEDSGDE